MEFFTKPRRIAARVTAALLSGAMLASLPSIGLAEDDDEDKFALTDAIFGEDAPMKIGGWTQLGYHTENNGVFNTHPDHLRLHQQYMFSEREADGEKGFDWGWRFDTVYGVDAQNTQSFGNPPGTFDFDEDFNHGIYGWAFPQLYGQVAMGDLSVKVGHFYTIIGNETVTAPDNFFYSHAFTFNFNEPFTHTGALGTYKVSDDIEVNGGWVAGWDTGFERNRTFIDRNGDGDATDLLIGEAQDESEGSAFLGGIEVKLTEDITANYSTVIGDFGVRGEGYMHSFVVTWDNFLMEDWQYIFQNDYLYADNVSNPFEKADSYAFNQYLIYSLTDEVKIGGRGEIWDYDGNTIYQATAGLNILPNPNLVIRPELRWQFAEDNASEAFFNNFFGIPASVDGETIFGIDAILVY